MGVVDAVEGTVREGMGMGEVWGRVDSCGGLVQ